MCKSSSLVSQTDVLKEFVKLIRGLVISFIVESLFLAAVLKSSFQNQSYSKVMLSCVYTCTIGFKESLMLVYMFT